MLGGTESPMAMLKTKLSQELPLAEDAGGRYNLDLGCSSHYRVCKGTEMKDSVNV
jgi:hypothetical protein